MTLSELYNNSDFEFDNGMLFNNDCLKIEKDENYFNIAKERIEKVTNEEYNITPLELF